MSAKKDIDVQRFSGVMDTTSDTVAVQPGNHRHSMNFEILQSNEKQFIFKTLPGNTAISASVKPNYVIVGWAAFGNEVYVLSKMMMRSNSQTSRLYRPFSFLYVQDGFLKVRILNSFFDVGDIVYLEIDSNSEAENERIFSDTRIIAKESVDTIVTDFDPSKIPLDLLFDKPGHVETLGWGEIGKFRVDVSLGEATYTPLYNHKNLCISMRKPFSREQVTLRNENSKIMRMYFTNYICSPKTINVRNAKINTPIGNISLSVGKRYMVIDGTASYGGVNYTPGGPAANLFSCTVENGTEYTGTARVIEYYPVELLDWQPDYIQGSIEYIGEEIGGFLNCGTYSAVYRCIDDEGAASPWSLPTNPIYLTKLDNENPLLANSQETMGSTDNEVSGKQVRFILDNIDQNWGKVQVALMRHVNREITENPIIFFEEEIESSRFEVVNDGTTSINAISLDEIQLLLRWFKKVMTIESMNNTQFVGNFESNDIIDEFEPTAVPIDYFTYPVIANQIASSDQQIGEGQKYIWNTIEPYNTEEVFPFPLNGHEGMSNTANALFKKLSPNVWYYYERRTSYSNDAHQRIIIQDSAISPSSSVDYVIGEVFKTATVNDVAVMNSRILKFAIVIRYHQPLAPISSTNDMTFGYVYQVVTGDVSVRANSDRGYVPYLQNRTFLYTGQDISFGPSGTVRNTGQKAYPYSGYNDGRNSLVQEKIASFPRKEKIRVGIQLVDKKGFKLPVRWLGDYTTPTIDTTKLVTNTQVGDGLNTDYLNHLGLTIGTENNPIDVSSIADKISGFHIVVAPIQRKVKAQGLLYHTTRATNDIPYRVAMMPTARVQDDEYRRYWTSVNPSWMSDIPVGYDKAKGFFSPDVMFKNIEELGISVNDKIVINGYVQDKSYESFKPSHPNEVLNYILGNRYAASHLNPRIYYLYNEFINPGEDRDPINSSLNIQSAQQIEVQSGVINHPSDPNVFYSLQSVTRSLATHPLNPELFGFRTLGRHRNYLFLAHDKQQLFGIKKIIDDAVMHVNIESPIDANYGIPENTQYISTGHFQPINKAIIEATEGKFWNVQVFGGQTFLSLFSQIKQEGYTDTTALTDQSEDYDYYGLHQIVTYPVESQIYPWSRTFKHAARDRESLIYPPVPESPVVAGSNRYIGEAIRQIGLNLSENASELFENSWAYSMAKTNGEEFDSWRKFLLANYRTAESELERIVALKKAGQNLVMWHDKGVSYAPVNDRAVINDSMGGELRLGFGGISDQSFMLSNQGGLTHRLTLVETENQFTWLDARGMNIMQMAKGSKPQPFNEENFLDTSLLKFIGNDQQLKKRDNSMFAHGIVGSYYPLTKDVYFTFFNGNITQRKELMRTSESFKTLVVNSTFMKVVGWINVPIAFPFWVDTFYYSQFPHLETPKPLDQIRRRNVIAFENGIYSRNTNGFVPLNLSNILNDFENWIRLFNQNQVFLYGKGLPMKYFTLPFSSELTAVVNKDPGMFKTFEALKMHGNTVSWSNLKWTVDTGQTSSENLPGIMRDYAVINSLPLIGKERPRGLGIEINLTFNSDDPQQPVNFNGLKPVVIIRQLETIFRMLMQR